LRGNSMNAIAAVVDLAPATVSHFAKKIEADWRQSAIKSIDELKAKELAKLDQLEVEAWAAWERSKEPKRREQMEADVVRDKEGQPQRRPKSAKTMREDQIGDVKYLNLALNCIDRRIKLLGLDEVIVTEGGGAFDDRKPRSTDERLGQYTHLFNNPTFVFTPAPVDGHDPGESLDSERSASEAGGILDVTGSVR
jgi:hypothetical protein